MFDAAVLAKLAKHCQQPFSRLHQIEQMLNSRFVGLEEAIRALVLSVASGEPLLLIGPPGTAKSRLIRAFCGMVGLLNEEDPGAAHPDYFEYLLTPFTEPGELFGFYNIAAARENRLVRDDEGMMQHAKIVYLDEVFNGSSAILNSILAFINERVFHDRGVRRRVAMQCLFGATNHLPDSPDLKAVFDRFVLRCHLENVQAKVKPIGELLSVGWQETYGIKSPGGANSQILEHMVSFRQTLRELTGKGLLVPDRGHRFHGGLAQLVRHARLYDLSEMSNRRLVKMVHIMLIHCLYEAVSHSSEGGELGLGEAELQLIPKYFLDRIDEEAVLKMQRTVLS